MKKSKLIHNPTDVPGFLSFADWYDELSSDVDLKAERFMQRRMNELRKDY